MSKVPRLNARKLLAATAGLATVSYLGTTSCSQSTSSGNLMAPEGSGGEQTSGVEPDLGEGAGGERIICVPSKGGEGGEGGEGSHVVEGVFDPDCR